MSLDLIHRIAFICFFLVSLLESFVLKTLHSVLYLFLAIKTLADIYKLIIEIISSTPWIYDLGKCSPKIIYNFMPYKIRKVTRRNCFRVTNRTTKRVFSKCTSRAKGIRQINLLRAIRYDKLFVKRRPTES